MERTAVNPWQWSVAFGFNQGEIAEGHTRTLFCAGQTSVDGEGQPEPPGRCLVRVDVGMRVEARHGGFCPTGSSPALRASARRRWWGGPQA